MDSLETRRLITREGLEATQKSLWDSRKGLRKLLRLGILKALIVDFKQVWTALVKPSIDADRLLQHYFYNLVDPAQVSLYGRPPNATNEALWQKAVRENPDRSCMVPVVAIGFDDLKQRVDAQGQQAQAHHEKLKVRHFLWLYYYGSWFNMGYRN